MALKKQATKAAVTAKPRAPRTLDFSPRTEKQKELVQGAMHDDIIFATGPAGTGKTFVCVAIAVKALLNKECQQIIVTRPIVEAGENLGFLPGTIEEKVDPYVAPIMDSLRKLLGPALLQAFMEEKKVQIIPLAYTRGRTYEDSYILGDEMQNATPSQMLMLLTRLGNNSKIFITGDESQCDLPRNQHSGLMDAVGVLHGEEGVTHVHFSGADVQRHKMVGKIAELYAKKSIMHQPTGNGKFIGLLPKNNEQYKEEEPEGRVEFLGDVFQ